MAAEALVKDDIEVGAQIVRALDEAGIKVVAAFWLLYEESGSWKLWIASPEAAKDLQAAYVKVADILASKGPPLSAFDLSRIKLVREKDRMTKAMGQVIRAPNLALVRFSKNMINGIYIEDALIYRLAA